ncbi:MAG: ATP-binding protein, partial [bacterium]
MKFYNRQKELKALNGWWSEKKSNLIIVYGKRRVGKTALCLEFIKNKSSVYFLSERLDIKLQLKKLSCQIGEFFNDDYTAKYGIDGWEQLFKYIAQKNKKFVLVIDEFPYLADAEPGISSIFQKGWDLYLKDSKVDLILCGSSIGMMEEHTLVHKSPLYGRRSGQILVHPFSVFDLSDIFPKKSFEDKIVVYSIVGGTITYLKYFIEEKNIWKAAGKYMLSKEQFLFEEAEFLLREELREPRNYFSILLALSMGKRKLGEIINGTGFDKSSLSSYLAILDQLRLTEKETPITEKYPEKSRKGLYRIRDEYFEFWFRFIFNNKRLLEEGKSREVLSIIKNSIIDLTAKNYEKFAIEFIKKEYPNFNRAGKWWDKNEEIDVVGINNETKEIIFGEVKWSSKKVGVDVYLNLKRKVELVDWNKENRKECYILFSKSGFTEDMMKLAKKE